MRTTESPTFGTLLKRHRRAAGLTQEELAERAGLSPRAIGDLERDLRQPRRDTLHLLLDALQLNVDEATRLELVARTNALSSPRGGSTAPPLQVGSFLGAAPPGPLVDREHEMHRILGAVDAVVGGSGRLVLLAGEPGIGKTRLAQELSLELARRGFLVAPGRCYEPERDVPFYPFLEAAATAYARAPQAIRDEVPFRWPHLAWLLPEDALQGGLPARSGRTGAVGEEQQLFWAVSGFLTTVAQEMPVALLLDDLHWADDASLKLLLHLARRTRSQCLLLVGTYRDVEIGPQHALARALVDLNRERLVERVTIHRLNQDRTAELIVATIGELEVSPELATMVHRGTDGNPFFVQEVLLALVERGQIYCEDGRWKCHDIQGFQTPETVRAAIAERLARLPSEAQAVLYRACVLGQTFVFEDVRALGHSSDEEVDEALEAATSAGLIREAGRNDYAFTHALTQQALYEDLSTRRRRTLHQAAGDALLRLPAEARHQRAAELAWHFRESGDKERAVEYTVQAGDRAAEVFAYGEAERLFRTALELAAAGDDTGASGGMFGSGRPPADPPAVALVLSRLGRVLDITEQYDEALPILERAAGLGKMLGDLVGEASAVAEIGWIHHNRGTDEEGLARVQPLVDRLEQEESSRQHAGILAALHTALSRLFFGLGRYCDELASAERAVDLARKDSYPLLLSVAEARHGGALMMAGRRPEARAALERAIALAETIGNLGTVTVALDNLGEIARDGGDYRQALRDCERAVALAEHTGVPGRIGWTLTKLGRIHLLLGDWTEARATFERALRLLGDDPRSEAHARMYLGQIDLLEGHVERGRAEVEAAMRTEAPGRDLWLRWQGSRLLAERDLLDGQPAAVVIRLGDLVDESDRRTPRGSIMFTLLFAPLAAAHVELGQESEAETVLARGMEQAQAQNHQVTRADLLRVRGLLRTRQQRWQEARDDLVEAIELVRQMPDPYREARTLAAVGMLAAQTGKTAEAQDHYRKALAIFQRLGAHPQARRIQRELAGRR